MNTTLPVPDIRHRGRNRQVLAIKRPATASEAESRHRAGFAFTLIELLVVIAVIAILAALLLPVLSKAQEQGRRVVSLNNTKQILLGAHLYAEDFNDTLPYCGAGLPPPYTRFALG